MRKIDLHIHTKASDSEHQFAFSPQKLEQYVTKRELDCIAVTNHNFFHLEQFRQIDEMLGCLLLPGIELDLQGGQLLLIANEGDVEDFADEGSHG